jgi:energy-coupling factor transport system ATP-binding protein
LAGLIREYEGSIEVMGREIREMKRREISSLIGYVWQNPYYGFIEPSVREEIMLIIKILRKKYYDEKILRTLVSEEIFSRDPLTLSGGEAKRVSLASVLIADQLIWLLDEPFDFLDLWGIKDLLKIIFMKRSEKTIIVSSVNTYLINLLNPDKVILLSDGEIKFFGEPESLDEDLLETNGVPPRRVICR